MQVSFADSLKFKKYMFCSIELLLSLKELFSRRVYISPFCDLKTPFQITCNTCVSEENISLSIIYGHSSNL